MKWVRSEAVMRIERTKMSMWILGGGVPMCGAVGTRGRDLKSFLRRDTSTRGLRAGRKIILRSRDENDIIRLQKHGKKVQLRQLRRQVRQKKGPSLSRMSTFSAQSRLRR